MVLEDLKTPKGHFEINWPLGGVVGIRLAAEPPLWSPLAFPFPEAGEFRLESPGFPPSPLEDEEVTSARPLIFRFSAVFRSEANWCCKKKYVNKLVNVKNKPYWESIEMLKTGSDKKIYWLGRYCFLLGFIMSKKTLEYKSQTFWNFWHDKTQKERISYLNPPLEWCLNNFTKTLTLNDAGFLVS